MCRRKGGPYGFLSHLLSLHSVCLHLPLRSSKLCGRQDSNVPVQEGGHYQSPFLSQLSELDIKGKMVFELSVMVEEEHASHRNSLSFVGFGHQHVNVIVIVSTYRNDFSVV